jgi:Tol biopolymer transport system component
VLIALAAAVATRLALKPAGSPKLFQLTAFSGEERHPAFSPDGQQVAFMWTGNTGDNLDIYVMSVAGGPPLRLTSDPSDEDFPAWSPDGRRIAFRRSNGATASLHVVASLGGPATKVADLGPVGEFSSPYPCLAWTPDGRALVAAHRGPDGGTLLLVPVEQGKTRVLLSNRGTLTSPAVSPDGRQLAFGACERPWVCDLLLATLGPDGFEGPPRKLTSRSVGVFHGITWSRDGRSLVYANFNERRLWRLDASGSSEPERLELPGFGARDPAASLVADRLLFSREPNPSDVDVWILERGKPARPLIASTLREEFPTFSPDGRRLALSWPLASSSYQIAVANADGTDPVVLAPGAGPLQGSPAWSPDGRKIAFDTGRIFVVDADGGMPRQLTDSPVDDFLPTWSPDGRFVYFCSNRSGRFEVWRVPSEGGDAEPVTHTGGWAPRVSPDGRTLYYLRQESGSPLFARSVAGGEERQVLESVGNSQYVVREDGLYYFAPVNRRTMSLRLLDLATGRFRELAVVEHLGRGLSVSPDGKTILYCASKPPNIDLFLIENFR